MPQAIQSVNVLFEISQDGGSTYKYIICIEGFTLTNTSPTSDADTQCGRYVGQGIEGSQIQGTGVLGQYPASNQLAYTDITNIQKNLTLVYYRIQYPTSGSIGSMLYQAGTGIFVDTSVPVQVGQVVKFGFTFKTQGARTTTPGQITG